MTRVATNERYLFDHIPRTGGMSMKAIFDDLFGPENVSPIVRSQQAEEVMTEMATRTMITGHFWHSPGSLTNRRRAYLTVLRRPEDWALSLYYFFRHNSAASEEEVVRLARAMELEEFFMSETPAIVDSVSNFLIRHFHQLSSEGYSTAPDDAHILSGAKDILARYDFVGIHEDFADSLDVMCYRFGWPFIPTIPRVNGARRRTSLEETSPEVRARLRVLTALDTELYEHGLRLFAERRRAMWRRIIELRDGGEESRDTPDEAPASQVTPAEPAPPSEFGTRAVQILDVEIKGAVSGSSVVQSGEDAIIRVSMVAREATDDLTVGIAIRDDFHRTVFGTNTHHLGERWQARPRMFYDVEFRMRLPLGEGLYFVTVALHDGPAHFERCFHWRQDAAAFEVRGRRGPRFEGVVDLSPTVARQAFPPLSLFSAELSADEAPDRMAAATSVSIPVRIKNTGDQTWPASGPRPVNAAYHWLDAAGKVLVYEGRRTRLPRDLTGGDEVVVPMIVEAPERPGPHLLRITLVQESVAWFEDHGTKPIDLRLAVGPA